MTAEAATPLLIYQFLAGLPGHISRQLHAIGVADNLNVVVERAKLLIAVDKQETTTAVSIQATEFGKLKTQLTEQVAALQQYRSPVKVYNVVTTANRQDTLNVIVQYGEPTRDALLVKGQDI